MPIFKPKSGPVLSLSRIVHCLLAATITAYGGHLWGYNGSALAAGGIIIAGFGWEVSNRYMRGFHPFGDVIDFWAFVVGAGIGNGLVLIL